MWIVLYGVVGLVLVDFGEVVMLVDFVCLGIVDVYF